MPRIAACFALALALIGGQLGTARAAGAAVEVGQDRRGQTTIVVSGAGASVTLPEIRAGLGGRAGLIEQPAPGVWLLSANLVIGRGVRLSLAPDDGVSELRLRSDAGRPGSDPAGYDYGTFVYLRTESGTIRISGVTVRSWDTAAQAPDAEPADGRAYILAKYDARLDIAGSDIGYLGSGDGESYGVSWRDVNDSAAPGTLRRRVTGEVLDSRFHHNYYGVYTYQASDMVFRGNRFDNNVSYGFDPHDYSANFVVEDNHAFNNGNHGFIISRGCTGFVFRRNHSYGNSNPDPGRLAHGFMLDPGSATSADPQAPSSRNLLEQNVAYDNEGYGLRILGSTDNIVRDNRFERNRQGITVEQGSTGNTIEANTIRDSRMHGIFVRGGADGARVAGNTVSGSGGHGIYVKADGGGISGNVLDGNAGSGIALLPEASPEAAAADVLLAGESLSLAAADDELLPAAANPVVDGAVIAGNRVSRSGGHGVELKGVRGAELRENTIDASGGHGVYLADGTHESAVLSNTIAGSAGSGIRSNGAATTGNRWSDNRLERNVAAPVAVTGGSNSDVRPPSIALAGDGAVAGAAAPGATVEILVASEPGVYAPAAKVTADAEGRFRAELPGGRADVLAIATRPGAGSSASAALASSHTIYLPAIIRR